MQVSDLDARARLLVAMPVCRRLPNGVLDVREPAPVVEDQAPFSPHARLAVRAGISASTILAGIAEASGVGPCVELEAAYRPRRALSLAVFAGYARFQDDDVRVIQGRPIGGAHWTLRESFGDLGVRLHGHAGLFVYGAGLGLTRHVTSGEVSDVETLRLVEADAAYTFAQQDRFAAQLLVVVETSGHLFDFPGQMFTIRVAIGFSR